MRGSSVRSPLHSAAQTRSDRAATPASTSVAGFADPRNRQGGLMPKFNTPQPITAAVEISAGSVRLVATDRDDTVVDVRPRDGSRSHDVKAAEQVRVDFSNGTLLVSSQRGFSFPRKGAVVVDIALPAGSGRTPA